MDSSSVLDLFRRSGALLEGHFRLSSGLHSPGYLQCALVLQQPRDAEMLGRALAEKVRQVNAQLVLSPAMGGIIIGHEVGRGLGVAAIFAERQDGKLVLRRGFALNSGERVLVVEDVLTTGLSTRETIDVARAAGAQVIVALTHLSMAEDKQLARCSGVDVIIGGHEHTLLESMAGHAPIFKMTSDARELGRIDATDVGLPPVVVGLFVTIFLWRNGPLGFLGILYTPTAMIFAQAVIATPIVAGITVASIQNLPANLKLQILALGATRHQMVWILVKEARLPLLAGVMAGFGGVISEVGASIMVGGNIKGYSRVLTTATVMETSRGNFDIAIALGIILLGLCFAINYLLTHFQQRERPR